MDWEFYSPFAHIEGRLEVCRIRSATHGVFDTVIVLGESTAVPATVYVNSEHGAQFMADRFPECTAIRVPAHMLRIDESRGGLRIQCQLRSTVGPVRSATVTFTARDGIPEVVPYGGDGDPVWGSRFTCEGVDLNLPAKVHGAIHWESNTEPLAGADAILTVGSHGKLTLRE